MQKVVNLILSAAIANAGTLAVTYPTGTSRSDFLNGPFSELVVNQKVMAYGDKFTLTFNATDITLTNKSGATWPALANVYLGLDYVGKDIMRSAPANLAMPRVVRASSFRLNLGNPVTSDDDSISVSASITLLAGATIGGAQASGGVATFDVPRNIIYTSAGNDSAKTFTATGTDEYGVAMKETVTGANAGIAAGKKAFKTITAVAISADSAGAVKIGCGDVLGLPVLCPGAGNIFRELQDGAVATAGTIVAADVATPTATTGDIRGTYDPNAACDGAKVFVLMASLPDNDSLGATQYNG